MKYFFIYLTYEKVIFNYWKEINVSDSLLHVFRYLHCFLVKLFNEFLVHSEINYADHIAHFRWPIERFMFDSVFDCWQMICKRLIDSTVWYIRVRAISSIGAISKN